MGFQKIKGALEPLALNRKLHRRWRFKKIYLKRLLNVSRPGGKEDILIRLN